MKEPVFGQKFMSTRSGTDNLTRELKDMFGTMTMDEVKIPRFEHLINKLRPLYSLSFSSGTDTIGLYIIYIVHPREK